MLAEAITWLMQHPTRHLHIFVPPVSGEVSTGVLLVEFSSGDLKGSHSKLNAKASGHFPF